MYAAAPVVALLSLLTVTWAAPVTYDQRQEGEWNVHAHLDNFVIILIPSSNAANLLDATKLNPFKTQLRHVFKAATQGQQPAEATQPRVADSSVKANGEEPSIIVYLTLGTPGRQMSFKISKTLQKYNFKQLLFFLFFSFW